MDAAGSGLQYRVKPAGRQTRAALDALLLIDEVRLLDGTGNALDRAGTRAGRAADAAVFQNGVGHQRLTDTGGAFLLVDMRLVLIQEVRDRTQHRVRRGLSQTAQRRVLDRLSQILQRLNVLGLAFSF